MDNPVNKVPSLPAKVPLIDMSITSGKPPQASLGKGPIEESTVESSLKTLLGEFKHNFMSEIKVMLPSMIKEAPIQNKKQCIEADDQLSIAASHSQFENENIDPHSEEDLRLSGILPDTQTDNLSDLFPLEKRAIIDNRAPEDSNDVNLINEILLEVDQELPNEEEFGLPINAALAKRISKILKPNYLGKETKKDLMSRHKLPENCKELLVPALNVEVREMKSFTAYHKRIEREYYTMQSCLAHANAAVIHLTDEVLKADQSSKMVNSKELVKDALDAVTLIGQASVELTNKRLSNLRSILAPDVRSICSTNRETCKYLLGDDLSKKLKEAREISRVSNNFSLRKERREERKPYYNNKSLSIKKSKYFLEKGKTSRQSSNVQSNRQRRSNKE